MERGPTGAHSEGKKTGHFGGNQRKEKKGGERPRPEKKEKFAKRVIFLKTEGRKRPKGRKSQRKKVLKEKPSSPLDAD